MEDAQAVVLTWSSSPRRRVGLQVQPHYYRLSPLRGGQREVAVAHVGDVDALAVAPFGGGRHRAVCFVHVQGRYLLSVIGGQVAQPVGVGACSHRQSVDADAADGGQMAGVAGHLQVTVVADVARAPRERECQHLQPRPDFSGQDDAHPLIVGGGVGPDGVGGAGLHGSRFGIPYIYGERASRTIACHVERKAIDPRLPAQHGVACRTAILDIAHVSTLVHHTAAIAALRQAEGAGNSRHSVERLKGQVAPVARIAGSLGYGKLQDVGSGGQVTHHIVMYDGGCPAVGVLNIYAAVQHFLS